MQRLSPVIALGLGILSLASPLVGQECRPDPIRTNVALTDFLTEEGLEVLRNGWSLEWGRTVGTIRPVPDGERAPTDRRSRLPVRIYSEGAPLEAIEALELRVANHVHFRPEEYQRFYLSEGDVVEPFAVAPSEDCAPRMTNQSDLTRELRRQAHRLNGRTAREARVNLYVGTDGRVAEAEIAQSTTFVDIDQLAIEVVRKARFRPATIEGVPVAVWVNFPVTFRQRRLEPALTPQVRPR